MQAPSYFGLQFPFTFCFEIGEISIKLLHSQNIRTYTKLTVKRDILLNINAKQGLTAKVTTSINLIQLGRSWKIWNPYFNFLVKGFGIRLLDLLFGPYTGLLLSTEAHLHLS